MDPAKLICRSDELEDGGDGVRFEIDEEGEATPAFAVRYHGEVRAYVNRCSHVSLQLDFMPGRFFDVSGEYLICATHGALYDPASGGCAGGPCNGIGLEPVRVSERDGRVELVDRTLASPAGQSADAL